MLIQTHKLPNPYELNLWGTKEQLTKQMVSDCLAVGLTKSLPLFEFEDHTDTKLHASRIAYFVTQLWDDPITVEVHYTEDLEPYVWVVEGCHRTAAALYLGMNEILAIHNEDVVEFINREEV